MPGFSCSNTGLLCRCLGVFGDCICLLLLPYIFWSCDRVIILLLSFPGCTLLFYETYGKNSTDQNSAPRCALFAEDSIVQSVPEHPKKEHVFCLSNSCGDVYLFQVLLPCKWRDEVMVHEWVRGEQTGFKRNLDMDSVNVPLGFGIRVWDCGFSYLPVPRPIAGICQVLVKFQATACHIMWGRRENIVICIQGNTWPREGTGWEFQNWDLKLEIVARELSLTPRNPSKSQRSSSWGTLDPPGQVLWKWQLISRITATGTFRHLVGMPSMALSPADWLVFGATVEHLCLLGALSQLLHTWNLEQVDLWARQGSHLYLGGLGRRITVNSRLSWAMHCFPLLSELHRET